MSYKVEAVSKETIGFGEGPLWDNRRRQLVFVDCFDKSINLYDPKTKELNKKVVSGLADVPYIAVAIPCASETNNNTAVNPNFLVSAADKLVQYNWTTEKSEILFEFEKPSNGKASRSFNDGKCDAKGRCWIGSLQIEVLGGEESEIFEEGQGVIHEFKSINNKLIETTHVRDYNGPNGLAWNKENTKLYFADLGKRVVNIYDFNVEDGTVENPRVFFDYNKNKDVKGSPDGLVTDSSGNVWVACWKGSCVIKIDGNTGQLLDTVKFPVTNTTSVCFGGDDYSSLFVTTTSLELSTQVIEGQPETGKLFCVISQKDNSFRGIQHYFAQI